MVNYCIAPLVSVNIGVSGYFSVLEMDFVGECGKKKRWIGLIIGVFLSISNSQE